MKCLGKGDASRRLKGSTGGTTYLSRKEQNILMRSSREISAEEKEERERKRGKTKSPRWARTKRALNKEEPKSEKSYDSRNSSARKPRAREPS